MSIGPSIPQTDALERHPARPRRLEQIKVHSLIVRSILLPGGPFSRNRGDIVICVRTFAPTISVSLVVKFQTWIGFWATPMTIIVIMTASQGASKSTAV